jgi:hypothetical protein
MISYIIIIILIILLVISNKHRFSKQLSNIDPTFVSNQEVYNLDGTEEKYPHKYECYFNVYEFYPELQIINKNHNIILQELNSIKDKDPKLWHYWIQNELKVFPFYFFGKWASIAKRLCPQTFNILQKIPKLKTAAFSCLEPGKQIQPHKGWADLANNVLRCHYGLIVPENCACVCDNFVVYHKNREWLVFDDSKMHTSFNYSTKNRIIFIIDMERPDIIPKGTSKVAYKEELMDFIKSFYDEDDIAEIKNDLQI